MKNKKIMSKVIASSLILALGAISSSEVFAYTKDETVYSKMDATGNSYETIVNEHLKNTENAESLNDMSLLKDIKNVNGDEEFKQNNNSLEWKASGNDIYYQGNTDRELPIGCNIKYELNGEEILAKDLVGKSGNVKITIEYTNKEARTVSINGKTETMYVPFVIMTSTMFDNTKASNIVVTNGKTVDNGKKTMVVAMACPGLVKSLGISQNDLPDLDKIEISFEAKEFEMESIMSYATPKVFDDLDISNLDKLNDIYGKVNELQSASTQLVNGANDLSQGVNEVSDGLSKLKYGVTNGKAQATSELQKSAKALSDGIDQIIAGKQQENQAIESYIIDGANKKLATGLKNGLINGNEEQAGIPAAVEAQLTALMTNKINNMVKSGAITEEQATVLSKNLALTDQEKAAMASKLSTGISTAIDTAIDQTTVAQKAGLKNINDNGVEAGLNQLKEQAGTNFSAGINKIASGFDSITNGTDALLDGANKLEEGSKQLSSGMQEFDQNGIEKIVSYINGDLKDVQERVEKLQDLANDYNNFAGLENTEKGNVKFIFIIDSLKEKDDNETKNLPVSTQGSSKEEQNSDKEETSSDL